MTKKQFTRPAVLIPLLSVAVIVGGIGLYLFQPWKLFVDETVNEAAPVAAVAEVPAAPADPDDPAPAPAPER